MQMICTKCGETKDAESFKKNKKSRNGRSCYCKACAADENAKWKRANPETAKASAAKTRRKYKDKIKAYNAEYWKRYYESNKRRINENKKSYFYARLKADPVFKLKHTMRCSLLRYIRGPRIKTCTFKYVGCTPDELRKRLESMFERGMTWENHGKWHIDHIIPCTAFDLNEESGRKACFHYSNLQPLWAADNIRKGAKTLWKVC